MPYIKQWIEPNDFLDLDEATRQELELDWFLTRQETAALVDRYLKTRDWRNPDGELTFDALTSTEQAALQEAAGQFFQAHVTGGDLPLFNAWDEVILEDED